ncbi:MAG: hypothetical protein QM731_03850 [Chitinophagaceae bacterium]
MIRLLYVITISLLLCNSVFSQTGTSSFYMYDSVHITINAPAIQHKQKTTLIVYALPNGNTTAQTMGKIMEPGDDWHFNIQHIAAQTRFIRNALPHENIIVAYLENKYKSWPLWKQKHADAPQLIAHIIDTLYNLVQQRQKTVYLNGHSGGGSFIFGYLKSQQSIPSFIRRISFLDSDYGYDSTYTPIIKEWLANNKDAVLTVFAYNDSVALYNNKPLVSPTGGTWYRSKLMLSDLETIYRFERSRNDSISAFTTRDGRIQFFFKDNPDRGIYHTQQVEKNGFIHSVLCATRQESKGYRYYDTLAYRKWIQ